MVATKMDTIYKIAKWTLKSWRRSKYQKSLGKLLIDDRSFQNNTI